MTLPSRLMWMCVGLLTFAACKKAVPEVDVSTVQPRVVLLNEAHDPAELRTVVLNELQSHSWATEGETGAQVLGRLNHRGQFIRVAIDYEPQRVVIRVTEAQANERSLDGYVGKLERGIRESLNRAPTPVAVVAPAAPPPPPAVGPAPVLVVFEREQADPLIPIQRGLGAHKWVLESQDPSGVIARLNHRKGMVRIRITADTRQASIAYVDSQDLSFDAGGRNDEYEKWMRNLSDAIRLATR